LAISPREQPTNDEAKKNVSYSNGTYPGPEHRPGGFPSYSPAEASPPVVRAEKVIVEKAKGSSIAL
jgi:hypothetical protein